MTATFGITDAGELRRATMTPSSRERPRPHPHPQQLRQGRDHHRTAVSTPAPRPCSRPPRSPSRSPRPTPMSSSRAHRHDGRRRSRVDALQRATPIISGFLLGYVAVLPLIGRIADLSSRQRVLLWVPWRSSSSARLSRPWRPTCRRSSPARSSRASAGRVGARDPWRSSADPVAARSARACRWVSSARAGTRIGARTAARRCHAGRRRLANDLLAQHRSRRRAGGPHRPGPEAGSGAPLTLLTAGRDAVAKDDRLALAARCLDDQRVLGLPSLPFGNATSRDSDAHRGFGQAGGASLSLVVRPACRCSADRTCSIGAVLVGGRPGASSSPLPRPTRPARWSAPRLASCCRGRPRHGRMPSTTAVRRLRSSRAGWCGARPRALWSSASSVGVALVAVVVDVPCWRG